MLGRLGFAKSGFQKGVLLADVPWYQKPEQGYIRMFLGTKNQNEGTFGSFPGTKNRNEGTFAKTTRKECATNVLRT